MLVCGDTADWPGESAVYRTAQGCWLRLATAALQQTVRYVRNERPALIAQLAVMFCMQPQQHDDDAALAARELRWQLAQCGRYPSGDTVTAEQLYPAHRWNRYGRQRVPERRCRCGCLTACRAAAQAG